MDTGTLSVTMICFNQSQNINEALEAILSQSLKPMEIIIVDEGSCDGSITILQEFAKKDKIIRLVINEEDMDDYMIRKLALSLVLGEYVYEARFENRVLPGFFESSMKLLSEHPNAALCCSNPSDFSANTKSLWGNKSRYFSPPELAEIIMGESISDRACIINRSAMLEAGEWINPELKWYNDWFFTHVIAFRQGICYIPESLVAETMPNNSKSFSKIKNWELQQEALNHLLSLLKSPSYGDVLPYFVRGSIMSCFNDGIVRVVMRNPGFWDMATIMLIQNPLWRWNFRLVKSKQERDRKPSQSTFASKARAILEKGNVAMAEGRLEEALSIFKYLTSKVPNMVEGHVALYKISVARGDFELACKAVLRAIKIEPNNPEFQNQLGIIYYRRGDYKMAETVFEKSLSLDPNNFNTCVDLGEIARRQGFYDKAKQYYQQALKIQPNNVDLLVASGNVALETNSRESARNDFERALSIDPSNKKAIEALKKLQ